MKRLIDLLAAFSGLVVISPVLLVVIIKVWMQDYKSPFYIASRVGKDGKVFNMVKLRSMVINESGSGPDSTSANDNRITPIGHFIRKFKLDEISQLWNVMLGDMSLVGPRPNVKRETDLYTSLERNLLSVRPGITDFASIVFSDEGEILQNQEDPDLAYNQLIRPWKSRLGLIYIERRSLLLDIQLILVTLLGIISKQKALNWVVKQLGELGVEQIVLDAAAREQELVPFPPPGTDEIVLQR
jgi:lipopolysaccharide/colanic/teichoic acid biosynthesis glycosyltransferase